MVSRRVNYELPPITMLMEKKFRFNLLASWRKLDPDLSQRLSRLVQQSRLFPSQVGSVTTICFTCFLIRCFVVRFGIPLSFEVVYLGYTFI
ncbi:hypothetical protein LINPERHAP1_LOCUS39860 [Linum perenne]